MIQSMSCKKQQKYGFIAQIKLSNKKQSSWEAGKWANQGPL